MNEEVAGLCPVDCNWEQRQKHASFFQNQIGLFQQAALSVLTSATIIITVGLSISINSDINPDRYWTSILITVIAWLLTCGIITTGLRRLAHRVRDAYLAEHAMLFPDATPYSLESYLLKSPDDFRRK